MFGSEITSCDLRFENLVSLNSTKIKFLWAMIAGVIFISCIKWPKCVIGSSVIWKSHCFFIYTFFNKYIDLKLGLGNITTNKKSQFVWGGIYMPKKLPFIIDMEFALAADLYEPKNLTQKIPAIAVASFWSC